ncbi:Hint domain-containing protein [Amylibacter sp. IMCC11727]|uniref:Hint domain-containing protein n=1 Tax=Amylibacter sp. IMCC11727 TaxID=3039851 RepID=UPI00244E1DDC|nr:Hint domain-containing protein [Amylibacter sp. IMCC11727]WGI21796.1 Hint domain-containing protein [Amylibacter sp. IMCC11727]
MAIVVDQTFDGNFDPGNPPTLPAAVTVVPITIDDVNDDGIIDTANGDTVNGSLVTQVFNGDTVTIGGVTITGATLYTADGGRYFTPTDGSILSDGTVTNVGFVTTSTQLMLDDFAPACFAEETLIETAHGPKSVQNLTVGDLIQTKDNGYQPLKWIGKSVVAGTGKFAPVTFAPGAVGNSGKLRVSPQHRMLISGWKCELMFAESEMLCAAKHLVGFNDRIYTEPCETITYYHLMFDQHEIVVSEGAYSESFFLGGEVAKSNRESYLEIAALFPELVADGSLDCARYPARPFLKKHEAAALFAISFH